MKIQNTNYQVLICIYDAVAQIVRALWLSNTPQEAVREAKASMLKHDFCGDLQLVQLGHMRQDINSLSDMQIENAPMILLHGADLLTDQKEK